MKTNVQTIAGERTPTDPARNALKHGMYAACILLPGDDAPQFWALRRRLFQDYEPRTLDEAQCVEGMAASIWRIWRWRRWEARFGDRLDAEVYGAPQGHLCRPESPHQWQHDTKDCSAEEARLRRLLSRDRAELLTLQRLRRNRLIDGAIHVAADYRDFLGEDNDASPSSPPSPAQRERGPGGEGLEDTPATTSSDGQIRKIPERTAAARAPALQRALLSRRERRRQQREAKSATSPSPCNGEGRVQRRPLAEAASNNGSG